MAGIRFAYRETGQVALRRPFPLGKNLSGAPTNENLAGGLYAGDFVVYTTASAVTTSSTKVVRTLVKDDKDAHYEEGGVRAGILGICESTVFTNSSGLITSSQSNGGVISPFPNMASMNPLHVCGHAQQTMIIATADTVFEGQLAVASATTITMQALVGGLAGITIPTTDNGNFTINVTDTGEDLMLYIVKVDVNDPNLKRVFFKILGTGLTPTGSYMQEQTATTYSTQ